jgi:hypothetical protein
MKWVARIVLILVVLFVVGQFIRPNLANPAVDRAKVLQAPPQVQSILDRSCHDCHSSETRWPWYTHITPVNWWLADHVKEGRRELNLSEWGGYTAKRKTRKLKEICDQVKEGEMPPKNYLWIHTDAKLSDADRQTLCSWASSVKF